MADKKVSGPFKSVKASRIDLKGVATHDQRQEYRTMAKLNEQTQDLKKSINVFNTKQGAQNPFLQSNNSQPQSQNSSTSGNNSESSDKSSTKK